MPKLFDSWALVLVAATRLAPFELLHCAVLELNFCARARFTNLVTLCSFACANLRATAIIVEANKNTPL